MLESTTIWRCVRTKKSNTRRGCAEPGAVYFFYLSIRFDSIRFDSMGLDQAKLLGAIILVVLISAMTFVELFGGISILGVKCHGHIDERNRPTRRNT